MDWSPMFMANPSNQLVFLQLRVLVCNHISIENVALVCLLRNCSELEHLAVRTVHGSYMNLLHILQFGSRKLKRINLHTIKLQEEAQLNNNDDEQLQRQFPNLHTRGCQI